MINDEVLNHVGDLIKSNLKKFHGDIDEAYRKLDDWKSVDIRIGVKIGPDKENPDALSCKVSVGGIKERFGDKFEFSIPMGNEDQRERHENARGRQQGRRHRAGTQGNGR